LTEAGTLYEQLMNDKSEVTPCSTADSERNVVTIVRAVIRPTYKKLADESIRAPVVRYQPCATSPTPAISFLTAALREARTSSRFEKAAYAALALGALVSVAMGVLQTERLFAHWPAVVKLVEGVLS
jgi:hypothetical protein